MSNSKGQIFKVTVLRGESGLRLDKLLAGQEFIPSRSRASELIERGLVTVNGKPLKASTKVHEGQQIDVAVPAPASSGLEPLNAPLDILFEDEDLLVVNKPAGLVVHPAVGHAQDTLVNILLHHVKKLAMGFGENRPGIVHRLDRDTSGVLVVAKNDFAHHALAEQFRTKSAHRIYWAIVHGKSPLPNRTIKSHLARHPQDRKRFASNSKGNGKLAITHFKVLQSLPNKMSWLECRLETGRTHQIRVHLSENGLPIAGDKIYGRRDDAPRMALHACELGFVHPRSAEKFFYRVAWPVELKQYAEKLGFKNV